MACWGGEKLCFKSSEGESVNVIELVCVFQSNKRKTERVVTHVEKMKVRTLVHRVVLDIGDFAVQNKTKVFDGQNTKMNVLSSLSKRNESNNCASVRVPGAIVDLVELYRRVRKDADLRVLHELGILYAQVRVLIFSANGAFHWDTESR